VDHVSLQLRDDAQLCGDATHHNVYASSKR